MTDIVERLRARQGGGDDEEVLMREAADAIERLRAALERIAHVLHPDDDFEHVETVGCAREIALSALNIDKRGEP
jgi:hypothetical protein